MRKKFLVVVAAVLLAASAHAGPVLDDLLNYPVVDQCSPQEEGGAEGLSLVVKGKAQWSMLTRETPLGQTFTLGPNANKLWRVSVSLCHWPDSWQQGEEVTFTLYGSPARGAKLYSRTIDYDRRWTKWDTAFDVHIPTSPGASYYFEISHNGGGDNSIRVVSVAGDPYKPGKAYVAGQSTDEFDLVFVAITKPLRDRTENLRQFLSQFNLDYPPLAEAKKAYESGDLDGACTAILREFETRTQPDSLVPRPVPAGKLDTTQVDKICDEGRVYNSKNDAWMDMTVQKTWREVWPDSAEYLRPNDVFNDLGRAYQTTGDEKYARKLNELMADFMQDYTSPLDGGMRGGRWVPMHVAWRLADAWGGFGAACKSKSLTDDVKLAWIGYWAHMADFAQKEHSGGNHANAVGEAMMGFAHRFPEYRKSEEWKRFGFDKLISNSLDLFYKDGACTEPTMNYHGFSLSNLLSGLDQARKYGYQIPEEINGVVERALSYTTYMLMPNGQIPSIGDTDPQDFRADAKLWDGWRRGEAEKCHSFFGRKDALYVSTTGKQGTRPAADSYYFADIGHYIIRSDWGGHKGEGFEDSRYMLLRAGHYGSHGHWDMNSVTLYAYGRPLLIDPGRTSYDSPLMPVLSSAPSHNVLLVDDQKMNRVAPKVTAWHTMPVIDFVDSSYTKLYTSVDHRRAIVFVRPGYYVMFDRATSTEPHRMGINFWLTPPKITIGQSAGYVCTNEPNGANLALKVASPSQVDIVERKGKLDLADRIWEDIPVVTCWQNGTTDAEWATVLYPTPKGQRAPRISTRLFGSPDARICVVKTVEGTDYVYCAKEASQAQCSAAGFSGRAGLVRTTDGRSPTALALVDGTSVILNDVELAGASSAVAELSVRYLADAVEVTCPKPEASLRIAALGRSKAIVNGTARRIAGDTFGPFGQ